MLVLVVIVHYINLILYINVLRAWLSVRPAASLAVHEWLCVDDYVCMALHNGYA